MSTSQALKSYKKNQGFTLVELLISITLGLLLLAGLLGVFQSNKRAAMFTKEQSRVQQDGRFSVDYIRQFLLVAGYDELFKPLQSGNKSGAPTLKISATESRDGVATTGNRIGDTLVVYYEVPSVASNIRTCNGSSPAATVKRIREEFWVDNNVFKCQSYNANKMTNSGTPERIGTAAELAGGVLDFQVQYGVNLTPDANVEPTGLSYLTATQVAAKNWGDRGIAQRVVSLKYALLIQAESRLDTASSTDNDKYYVLDHKFEHTGLVANIYTSSFKLRNGG